MIIAGIVLLGCVVRLAACFNTCVINQDGVLYIQQAKALYAGELAGITEAGMPYLSIYPVFTALAYSVAGDWIRAAMGVSYIFGCAALLPMFLLLRRFFDSSVTGLGLLLFAVMPVFVDTGCMLIKEPIAVFFIAWGLHFFLSHLERAALWPLSAAGTCFLLASWARVESLMFFAVSGLFLLFVSPRRWAGSGAFLLPLAGLAACVAAADAFIGLGAAELFRSEKIEALFTRPLAKYNFLRATLKELAFSHRDSTVGLFLAQSRRFLWFTALGGIFKCLVKALFYPFVVFAAVGLPGAFRLLRRDRRAVYLSVTALAAFFVLYFHQLTYWAVYPRFMTLPLVAAMFVLCCGIRAVRDFLQNRLRFRHALAVGLLALCLVLSTLPKNTRSRECDKLVFKDIGEAAADACPGPVLISASAPTQRWVSFYANLGRQGPFHPGIFENDWEQFPRGKKRFVAELRKRGISYILWDQKSWGKERFAFSELLKQPEAWVVGTWRHPDTGKMILLKLKGDNDDYGR
jgi:hypothetical protein